MAHHDQRSWSWQHERPLLAFQFRARGLQRGIHHQPDELAPLGTATPRYLFTDTNAPANRKRYYRLRYP